MERVATDYNNQISNRKMFTSSTGGNKSLNLSNLAAAGLYAIYGNTLLSDGGLMPTGNMISFSGGTYNIGDTYNTNYKIATKNQNAIAFTAPTGSPAGMTSGAHSAPSTIPSGTVGVTTGSWSAGTDVNNGTTVSRTYSRTNTEIKKTSTSSTTFPQKTEAEATAAGYTAIHNLTELQNQISANPAGKYMLVGDIDASGLNSYLTSGWEFKGTLDGNGYNITGLTHTLFDTIDQSGSVSNLTFQNCNITTGNSMLADTIEGNASINNIIINSGSVTSTTAAGALCQGLTNTAKITNCSSSADITGSSAGGLVCYMSNSAKISNCSVTGEVYTTEEMSNHDAGGIVANMSGGTIENSYYAGSYIYIGGQNGYSGGLVGRQSSGTITNSYVGNTAMTDAGNTSYQNVNMGGLIGSLSNGTVSNCFTSASTTLYADYSYSGDAIGEYSAGTVTNCYSPQSGGILAAGATHSVSGYAANGYFVGNNSTITETSLASATSGWDTNAWDTTNPNAPTLKPVTYGTDTYTQETWTDTYVDTQPVTYTYTAEEYAADTIDDLEEGIRSGKYMLAKEADQYTQSPINIDGTDYEEKDWRTIPEINDELYKADDVNAEDKYDRIVSEINAQDKKLQLEQASIEVEYKAVSSEKEAVKKILDTNAQSSFKYFS